MNIIKLHCFDFFVMEQSNIIAWLNNSKSEIMTYHILRERPTVAVSNAAVHTCNSKALRQKLSKHY